MKQFGCLLFLATCWNVFPVSAEAHLAASMCNVTDLEEYLQEGFSTEVQNPHNGTLLIAWATLRGMKDIAFPNPCDKQCIESLELEKLKACTKTFKVLMRYKADINVKNDRGTTPLMKAAQIGHLFALKLIAAEGAKINAINNYGNTALHEAVYNNRYECLQYLLEINADTTIKNIRNLTPLEVAKKKKDQKSIQILETAAKRRHG